MHTRTRLLTGLGLWFLALVGGLIAAQPAAATGGVIAVTTTNDEFDMPANAACSLREAIQAISNTSAFGGCPAGAPGDVIQLQGGVTYTLTRSGASHDDNNVTGDLDLLLSMSIVVTGGRAVVDAAGLPDRVFDVISGTVEIADVAVQNGTFTAGGGFGGGGIRNVASLTLTRVKVIDNRVGALGVGGGILNGGGGQSAEVTLTVVDSIVSGNDAWEGGGIYNLEAMTITRSSIISNTAQSSGGGVANGAGSAALRNVTVSGNLATAGDGGGIYNTSLMNWNNVTVARNRAGNVGGGVGNTGNLTFSNSLIVGNTGNFPDCSGSLTSLGFNFIENPAGCSVSANSVISNTDPLLGPLGDNGGESPTHALLLGSPGIDRGNPAAPGSAEAACEVDDQRGQERAAPCDIGAYESNWILSVYLPLVLR